MMLGEAEEARDVVRDVTEIFGEFNVSDFIWLFKKLDLQGFGKRIEDLFMRFDTLVERVISKREEMRKNKRMVENKGGEKGAEFRDFLDVLLDCVEDENSEVKIERVHIKALIMDFFTAGTDTTAISTEWALVELMNNPSLLKKAREEIDKIVGKNRLVDESDGPNLPYLQAIMKETFRLHPPVPMILPFGSGRRMCPGVTLAMQEVPALLGAIIQCFDFHVVDSNGEIMKGGDIVIDVNERPGLTAPRVHDLVCVPVERIGYGGPLQTLGC
ncbi:hypothetical protein TSUD_172230 [Trifolium subterraneum]|uniref:Uncharacterized protein n=1 Tax=Trifolium subterraneum TaxID=3900 RepID=A0A2Z6LW50_TRISU|nr:hypothetical protein TSUD_172230 [Trifolium subterraneum]